MILFQLPDGSYEKVVGALSNPKIAVKCNAIPEPCGLQLTKSKDGLVSVCICMTILDRAQADAIFTADAEVTTFKVINGQEVIRILNALECGQAIRKGVYDKSGRAVILEGITEEFYKMTKPEAIANASTGAAEFKQIFATGAPHLNPPTERLLPKPDDKNSCGCQWSCTIM